MNSFIFGKSQSNLPIIGHRFGTNGPKLLLLGGVHGDEIEGVVLAQGLLEKFLLDFPYRLQLTLVPMFNLDGVLLRQRKNIRGVDLNRNLPTNDWTKDVLEERYYPGPEANSESENQALVHWIQTEAPSLIFSFHSWKPLLNTNGKCHREAEVISKLTGYKVEDSIGYPTPGCLGTYTGLERDIPTLTYEVERGLDSQSILNIHVPAVTEALKLVEERG